MPLTPHIASSKVPMRGGPRPQHVLYRGNGVYAPLIAFDELPPDIQLQGVSRILTSAQTAGMTFLGEQDHAGFYTSVQGHRLPLRPAVLASSSPAVGAPSSANANNRAPFQAPDARIRQSLQQNGVAMSKNASQESHHSSPGSLPTGNVRSPVAAEASSDRARTGPDSTVCLLPLATNFDLFG